MIVILSKEPGQGGSYQIGTWEEPILWIDLENRVQRTIDAYYSDKIITVKHVWLTLLTSKKIISRH